MGRRAISPEFKAQRVSASISPEAYKEYQALLEAGTPMSTIIEEAIRKEYRRQLKAKQVKETQLVGQQEFDLPTPDVEPPFTV